MSKDPKPNDNKKKKFNSEAFKYAIGMLESSGGKHLTNPNSSASGKYHFLWKYLATEPSLKGISQREFISNPELQEEIMNKAINGKLKNYPNYVNYSKSLKSKYNSDLPAESIAALTHFMGAGAVKSYLKNKSYDVPGVNLTAEDYEKKFNKFMEAYKREHSNPSNVPSRKYTGPTGDASDYIRNSAVEASQKKIDNTSVSNSNFIPPTGLKTPDNFKYGGKPNYDKTYDYGGKLDRFENGGTHEENPLGGIPQGIGANGKPNLVEEGETKWNDYIFSNSITMDGTFTDPEGNSVNVFKEGGNINGPGDGNTSKDSPVIGAQPEPIVPDNSFDVTKYSHLSMGENIPQETMHIPDLRENYKRRDIFALNDPETIDFRAAVKGAPAEAFLSRYNDPITRQRMADQAGVTPEQIDNMILKGLEAEKKIGGNTPGSKASYRDDTIHIGHDFDGHEPVETHERLHASGIDAVMGKKLTDILGNAFHQESKSWMKKHEPDTLRYLNKPHEAYGNFAEFRSSLGLKPGEQIDEKRLKKLVKEKGLENENFYRAYDRDKIIEALNTVAYQDSNNNKEYRLS